MQAAATPRSKDEAGTQAPLPLLEGSPGDRKDKFKLPALKRGDFRLGTLVPSLLRTSMNWK